jgi:hypothetical protein
MQTDSTAAQATEQPSTAHVTIVEQAAEQQPSNPRKPYRWGVCKKPECGHRILSKNKSRLCKRHYDEDKNRNKRGKLMVETADRKQQTLARLLGLSELPTVEELRADVAWEARHKIADHVGCRVCGVFPKTPLWQRHLREHQMTLAEYHAAYPGARLWSFTYTADANAKSGEGSSDVQELMANFADLYFTPEQISEGRRDAKWEKRNGGITDVVMCRICGRKIRGWFPTHLELMHQQLTINEYLTKWPNAPTKSDATITRHAETSKRTWRRNRGELQRLRATALPDDWPTKPTDWVFIGLILLQRAYTSNEELQVCLDASGGPKCRYSEDGSWGIITHRGQAANYITAIRKWVDRPGKTPSRK